MRQVPHYLLIGDGNVALHMRHYFDALGFVYETWSRAENNTATLLSQLEKATHVLLLIKDDAIDSFIQEHKLNQCQHLTLVHFSGCLVSEFAYSAHPLQTFSDALYPLKMYSRIPFVLEKKNLSFSELLPGLDNPSYEIDPEDKPYYHALCVMANNFTSVLWDKFFSEMHARFKIEKVDLLPLLEQTFSNISKNSSSALTGPLARGDKITLQKNIDALEGDSFGNIFKAFVGDLI